VPLRCPVRHEGIPGASALPCQYAGQDVPHDIVGDLSRRRHRAVPAAHDLSRVTDESLYHLVRLLHHENAFHGVDKLPESIIDGIDLEHLVEGNLVRRAELFDDIIDKGTAHARRDDTQFPASSRDMPFLEDDLPCPRVIKGNGLAGMTHPVGGTDDDGHLVLEGPGKGMIGDIRRLRRRRRVENGDPEKGRDKAGVLLRLGRLRARVVTGDNDKPSFDGLLPRPHERRERYVETYLLHETGRPGPAVRRCPEATSKAQSSFVDHSVWILNPSMFLK
jgi:hypothetical protein